MKQKTIAGIVAAIALVIGVYAATIIAPPKQGIGEQPGSAGDTAFMQRYPQPRELSEFTLTSHDSEVFTKDDFRGKWSLLFVGYTYCPDICPTTLAELNNAYPDIIAAAGNEPLQIVFLSVDPKRDTPERLKQYMQFFNEKFVGVTGEHSELFPLVRSMGMMYSMTESTDNPNYLVDHSASVVVINPQAQVIGRFKPEHKPGAIPISDTAQIIADLPRIMGSR
ncbi:SCO family protein [Alteromonas oceanisediminis]|uniref:SCO family protein n=1 Tax=Alteromonas oceanisediminis TaxID=2836180 RepID=UPI001BD97E7C|nr:SCO family protein [Alteromonas oceanisediminis]MBT0587884.1 SCO family protein [Alteromonas oceanisediminis]